jgi:hypothetical protein
MYRKLLITRKLSTVSFSDCEPVFAICLMQKDRLTELSSAGRYYGKPYYPSQVKIKSTGQES